VSGPDHFAAFDERELERFAAAFDAVAAIRKRSHLFLWLQGQAQSLVAHELLLCAHGDLARRALRTDHFSSYPLPESDLADLVDMESGLLMQAVRAWAEHGEQPLLVSARQDDAGLFRRFESTLFRYGLQNLAIHGTPSYPGFTGSYFVFARVREPWPERQAQFLDMLMPQLHVALVRVLVQERVDTAEIPTTDSTVTAREIEILQWVREGKSNQEIGHILGISPLTVKNHVQKILKKLHVQNRAQAVGKAISLRLIKSASA
jgi:transcriptional regulator EpsA